MLKHTTGVGALAAWLLVLAACRTPSTGAKDPDPLGKTPFPAEAVDWADSERGDLAALVQAMTRFGVEAFGQVAEPGNNVVLSPASIAMAFGLARAGAEGKTAEEIDAVLGFPADEALMHASFDALDRLLDGAAPAELGPLEPDATRRAIAGSPPPALEIANGVFPQRDFPVRQDYVDTLAAHYGAGAIPVDFTIPEGAKQVIDQWVSEKTRGRIEQLFDALDPATRLVLANAIYLKADWLVPFAEYPTRPMPFTLADGSKITVPTMREFREMRYAQGDGWQAVELPYAGERLAMWVLVPSGDRTAASVLTPEVLDAVGDGLTEAWVELHLPRWDFDTDVELIPLLQALGMRAPFDPAAADFSGITSSQIWIGDAIHRATITVDEWGTEAAAVTGLAFPVSGAPPPEAVIHADRPFAFVILDTEKHAPLFLGQVADPLASEES